MLYLLGVAVFPSSFKIHRVSTSESSGLDLRPKRRKNTPQKTAMEIRNKSKRMDSNDLPNIYGNDYTH